MLHWDGKLLPDITVASPSREKAERIAILASGDGVEFLFGVPKIGSSSGTDQANACLSAINDRGLSHQIKAIVLGTTASNTGLLQGACIKIQEQLQSELVWLACLHHVYEVILVDVFRSAYGPSSGPSIPLFSCFQDQWRNLDKRNFKTAEDDEEILANFVSDWSVPHEEAMRRLEVALRLTATRDDYRELTTLAYIFLGGTPPGGISFRAPGAFHHARWMEKGIYCIKIFLFHDQFPLTEDELKAVRDASLLAALCYVAFWNESPIGSYAAKNDMDMMKLMQHGIPN